MEALQRLSCLGNHIALRDVAAALVLPGSGLVRGSGAAGRLGLLCRSSAGLRLVGCRRALGRLGSLDRRAPLRRPLLPPCAG